LPRFNVEFTPSLRVLHVDDDADFLKMAKQCLESEGHYRVETALSIEEAFKKLKANAFGAIVSGERIRAKSGLDFLQGLREKGIDTPFVILGGDNKGREVEALSCDGVRCISKFGEPEMVYKELGRCIEESTLCKKERRRTKSHARSR
jgi:DNA-binding NtrC family response regulator